MKIRDYLHSKAMQLGCTAAIAAGTILPSAFALDESSNSVVVSAINSAVTSVKGDAATVIGTAVGLGAVFWAARVLWSKFRGMAK